jgi:hypothetical protein
MRKVETVEPTAAKTSANQVGDRCVLEGIAEYIINLRRQNTNDRASNRVQRFNNLVAAVLHAHICKLRC